MSTTTKSVLFFIESGGPGGAERVVLKLAVGFQSRGLRVHVATLRTGWLVDELHKASVPHTLINSERSGDIRLPFRIASIARQHGCTTLHSHLLDSNFYGAIAARIGRLQHVATEHGDVHHISPKKFLKAKLCALSLLGSRIVAVSKFSADRLVELGVPETKITVIGNPIEPAQADAHSRVATRASLGVPAGADEHFVWVHVANLRPVKDQQTLLRGFHSALTKTTTPQSLLLVGDGKERAALEHLSTELGLTESVRFLGFQNNVPEWLNAADGFVLSSRSEALPMSLLEASTYGLVPVVTAVGGLPEVVEDGISGFLFPAGDSDALGERLSFVVNHPEAATRAVQHLAATVAGRFAIDGVLDRYERLYQPS